MKKIPLILFSFAFCVMLSAQQIPKIDYLTEEAAVKTVVDAFLTAAGNYDIDSMPSLFTENANIGGVSFKNGKWVTYTMTLEGFMSALKADSNPAKYTEPVSEYTIHMTEGMLAFVKADATLYVGGVAKTYNYDYFTLIKEGAVWKILNGSYVAVPVEMGRK